MKTKITKKLIGLALSAFSLVASAQCPTIDSLSVTLGANGTASITPVLSGSVSATQTMYYWSVTPNSAALNSTMFQAQGEFQFQTNGTYTVCASYSDSANGCSYYQFCKTITINNMSPASCNASFISYTDSNCVTHFTNTSAGTNLTYDWTINGTHYSNTNPTLNNLPNGTYLVMLQTFYAGQPCDSVSQNIVVGCSGTNTVSCQADFISYTDSNCVTYFTNTSVGNNLTYQWYDGTGNVLLSTSSDPSLSLPDGTYYITLNTFSSGTFCDSTGHYVYVNCGNPSNTCIASYTYYRDSSCVTHFINTSSGTNLSYAWQIDGISYSTADPIVYLYSGYHSVYLNTYTNGQLCDSIGGTNNYLVNSCSTNTVAPCQANAQFSIFPDSLNAGNFYAYNYSSGSGNVTYAWDFGDGSPISTQQYPLHQYAIPGQYIICLTVTGTDSSSTCTSTHCDSSSVQRMAAGFLMSQIQIIPAAVTGIKQVETNIGLKAYPNPMADELTIEATTTNDNTLNFVLVDALGRTVMIGNLNSSKTNINTSSLEKGFYSLSITNEKGSSLKTIKLVK